MKMNDYPVTVSVTLSELVDLIDACKIARNEAVVQECPLCAKLYTDLYTKLQLQHHELTQQAVHIDPVRGDR